MSQITIKDIARTLRVSPSTVSRALRNHPDISSETKKKILALAKELDYHPNSIAQSLQRKETKTIGVIVPEVKHYFFSSVISGIEDLAYQSGYTIIVCQSNEDNNREIINTRALVSHRVAGLLVSVSQTTKNYDHFKVLLRQRIPIIFFDRVCEDINFSKVVVDDYQGAFSAVEHLISSGYKKIAHLAGPKYISIGRERIKGYKDALKKYCLSFDEDLVVIGGLNEEDGSIGLQKLLNKNKIPDAIFAVNDPVAVGAFIKIKQMNLKVPDDIALVGFSDNPIASLIDPPLTTVRQPSYDMGKKAVELLLDQIKATGKKYIPQKKVLKTELIVRKST